MSNQSWRSVRRPKYPHEQTWLREFVGFHGTDNAIRFCEDDLRGVPLVKVLHAISEGEVISAEKCDVAGTDCVIFCDFEEDTSVIVNVHFISNEDVLTILSATETRDTENEPHQSA